MDWKKYVIDEDPYIWSLEIYVGKSPKQKGFFQRNAA